MSSDQRFGAIDGLVWSHFPDRGGSGESGLEAFGRRRPRLAVARGQSTEAPRTCRKHQRGTVKDPEVFRRRAWLSGPTGERLDQLVRR